MNMPTCIPLVHIRHHPTCPVGLPATSSVQESDAFIQILRLVAPEKPVDCGGCVPELPERQILEQFPRTVKPNKPRTHHRHRIGDRIKRQRSRLLRKKESEEPLAHPIDILIPDRRRAIEYVREPSLDSSPYPKQHPQDPHIEVQRRFPTPKAPLEDPEHLPHLFRSHLTPRARHLHDLTGLENLNRVHHSVVKNLFLLSFTGKSLGSTFSSLISADKSVKASLTSLFRLPTYQSISSIVATRLDLLP